MHANSYGKKTTDSVGARSVARVRKPWLDNLRSSKSVASASPSSSLNLPSSSSSSTLHVSHRYASLSYEKVKKWWEYRVWNNTFLSSPPPHPLSLAHSFTYSFVIHPYVCVCVFMFCLYVVWTLNVLSHSLSLSSSKQMRCIGRRGRVDGIPDVHLFMRTDHRLFIRVCVCAERINYLTPFWTVGPPHIITSFLNSFILLFWRHANNLSG